MKDPKREAELNAFFHAAPAPEGDVVPPGTPPRELPPEQGDGPGRERIKPVVAHVEQAIRKPARRSQPGPLATRPEHFEDTEDGVRRMANLIVRLVLGQETRNVTRAHATGEVIATEKPKGGIRPLIMSSIFRRIGLGAIAKSTQAEAMAASGPHQLGVGAKDGCVKAFRAIAVLAEVRPTKAAMSCDVGAAHQSLNRRFITQEVMAFCPILERPLAVWYPQEEPTVHWWRVGPGSVMDVLAEDGLDQGCTLACPAFGVSSLDL